MKKISLIWLIAVFAISCFCLGCGQKQKERKIVARVNDYVMSVDDLENEIAYAPYAAVNAQDIDGLLDLAIRKQVLIQEAQRQRLDRSKSFMKTIERYWEQTLIKELLQKQTRRIYKSVGKQKQVETLNDWMEGLYRKADIEIYKNVLMELEKEK